MVYGIFKWIESNKQTISEALWLYIAMPLAVIAGFVAAFLLVRFLWRCGQWTVGGFFRYLFNLAAFFYLNLTITTVFIKSILHDDAHGLLPVLAGTAALCILPSFWLTVKLAREYGRYGVFWDLLRSKKTATKRQVAKVLLPLLRHPNGGWLGPNEWNDPFIRGFFIILALRLVRTRCPNIDGDDVWKLAYQSVDELWRRTGLMRPAILKNLEATDELATKPGYCSGEIAGWTFVKHYYKLGLLESLEPDVTALFQDVASKVRKPHKLKKLPYARSALVKHILKPRLEQVISPQYH